MSVFESAQATEILLLEVSQLETVRGGCSDCHPQLYAPSNLALFSPSVHLAVPGASQTAHFQQPPDYFRLS